MSQIPPQPNPTCPSGVQGLDEILSGGLPAGSMYLIRGDPGVGKTTLALQFLFTGRDLGESVLYITLSETRKELNAVAFSHGWTLDGVHVIDLGDVEGRLLAEEQSTVFHPAEVELNEITAFLKAQVIRLNPSRVAFDSLSELRLMTQSALRFRRQMLALKQFFAARQCTVMFLDDNTATEAEEQVESIAHGVINLEKLVAGYGKTRRQLNVEKLRGVNFHEGNHDYVIRHGGIVVFPTLRTAVSARGYSRDLVPSGLKEMDDLVQGGLQRGTSNLFIGPAGAGKSVLATQYAVTSAQRNERVAIFNFDENLGVSYARSESLNPDFSAQVEKKMIHLTKVDIGSLPPGELAHRIKHAVEVDEVRMVIVDSINGYLNAMPDEKYLILQLREILTYLHEHDVTSIIMVAQHGMMGSMNSPVDVTFLADTVVLFRFFEVGGSIRKALSVAKKRVFGHESTIREYMIDGKGIRIGAPLSEFHGVLTGVPSFVGATGQMLEPNQRAR